MQLVLDPRLKKRIPGATFGIVTISNIEVRERDERLWQLLELLGQQEGGRFTLEQLGANEPIAAVRALQKAFGFDPGRYRPSSEALLRRVLKGQGLPQINTAVDVNTLCSLEFLLPMCIYDLKHVRGAIRVRIGEAGEAYPGIGRQVFQAAQKVIIADDEGVIGSTVSDSERTKVTTETKDIFLAIYAPTRSDPRLIESHAALAGKRMVEFNGGQASDIATVTV